MASIACVAACVLAGWPGAGRSATLSGVSMPDTLEAGGAHMVLNGIALRTYSFLRFHIYVAGLYLEQRSSDSAAIMASSQTKLMRFQFLRDVSAEAARRSWRDSLARNCTAPCHLDPGAVSQFLARVPAVHEGDVSSFLFEPDRLVISLNGDPAGTITDRTFEQVVLAGFIGDHPTVPEVRDALLGKKP